MRTTWCASSVSWGFMDRLRTMSLPGSPLSKVLIVSFYTAGSNGQVRNWQYVCLKYPKLAKTSQDRGWAVGNCSMIRSLSWLSRVVDKSKSLTQYKWHRMHQLWYYAAFQIWSIWAECRYCGRHDVILNFFTSNTTTVVPIIKRYLVINQSDQNIFVFAGTLTLLLK